MSTISTESESAPTNEPSIHVLVYIDACGRRWKHFPNRKPIYDAISPKWLIALTGISSLSRHRIQRNIEFNSLFREEEEGKMFLTGLHQYPGQRHQWIGNIFKTHFVNRTDAKLEQFRSNIEQMLIHQSRTKCVCWCFSATRLSSLRWQKLIWQHHFEQQYSSSHTRTYTNTHTHTHFLCMECFKFISSFWLFRQNKQWKGERAREKERVREREREEPRRNSTQPKYKIENFTW